MTMDRVYEVTNRCDVGGTTYMNVMHFMFPVGDPTFDDTNELIETILANFYAPLGNWAPTGADWVAGAKVTSFDKSNPSNKLFVPATSRQNFTGSGERAVSQLAICINWFSATPGRSSTGRNFYGPLVVTAISNGKLSASAQSSATAACNLLPASVSALTPAWWFGVYSKKDHEFYPILTGHTDGIVDTLRSRKT
jgi:hypothetical protein